jgi:hypothetical protein
MSDTTDWIKLNLPELNSNQAKMLARYIKQLRIDEIEMYADHLCDCEEEAAFEMEWQAYVYKRTRAIDNE